MGRAGRELEILVAMIEEWHLPKDAQITSPDTIPDKDTGKGREVDVSIRYRLGSADVLVTIECRDRRDIEDVTWIEQLASKRGSIRADKTIAVSSSGFTRGAVAKANELGITLRTIEDLSEADVVEGVKKTAVSLRSLEFQLHGLNVEAYDASTDNPIQFSPAFLANLRRDPYDTPLGFEISSKKPLTVRMLMAIAWSTKGVFDDLVSGPSWVRKTIHVEFPQGTFALTACQDEHELKWIELTVDAQLQEVASRSKFLRYLGDGDEVMQAGVVEIPEIGKTLMWSNKLPSDHSSSIAVPPGEMCVIPVA